ncbi:putative all-trans-retinol 13,14-reductase [Portunus trituberculatus]|uniref:Putative all-trans-retinol 13,14-reductase n=1 Tax=Portunus trituberculatus TaxID=210409 RepID=A0A5B7E7J4_PORTR|nr:putative all-trans-retinol 13,14-reductase [Portunus trituberculatus]
MTPEPSKIELLAKLTLDYLKMSREEGLDVDVPLLFISFPSTKDPEWKKKYPGKTTMAIVTLMPYDWVSEWNNNRVKKRGDEYESIKKTFGHKAVEQACRLFPSIRDHIDYVSVGTPVSNNYYLGAPRGEIYGLDHTRERFSLWNNAILRAKTDIPGLVMRTTIRYTGITSNTASKRYSGGCEKGDDGALYTTKFAVV